MTIKLTITQYVAIWVVLTFLWLYVALWDDDPSQVGQ